MPTRGGMAMGIDLARRVMAGPRVMTGFSAGPITRVMAGLVPATHDFLSTTFRKTWVTGPIPAMTRGRQGLLP